eukprot:356543-Chlamydomonas_euryale.AAC.5
MHTTHYTTYTVHTTHAHTLCPWPHTFVAEGQLVALKGLRASTLARDEALLVDQPYLCIELGGFAGGWSSGFADGWGSRFVNGWSEFAVGWRSWFARGSTQTPRCHTTAARPHIRHAATHPPHGHTTATHPTRPQPATSPLVRATPGCVCHTFWCTLHSTPQPLHTIPHALHSMSCMTPHPRAPHSTPRARHTWLRASSTVVPVCCAMAIAMNSAAHADCSSEPLNRNVWSLSFLPARGGCGRCVKKAGGSNLGSKRPPEPMLRVLNEDEDYETTFDLIGSTVEQGKNCCLHASGPSQGCGSFGKSEGGWREGW